MPNLGIMIQFCFFFAVCASEPFFLGYRFKTNTSVYHAFMCIPCFSRGLSACQDEPDWDADDDRDEDEDLPAASGQAAPVTPPRRSPKMFTGKSKWQKKSDGCDDALEAETEPNVRVSTDKTGCVLVTDQTGRIITRLMPEAKKESMGQEMEGSKMYRLAQKIAKEAIETCGLSPGPELMLKSHVSMLKNSSRDDLSTMLSFCTCCFGRVATQDFPANQLDHHGKV